jgi:hypothetical protein
MGHAALNSLRQLVYFPLDEFNYAAHFRAFFDSTFPPAERGPLHRSAAYEGTMPVWILSIITYIVSAVSLVYLLYRRCAALRTRTAASNVWRLFDWICVGICANAVTCGALSGVAARYQARVVWLFPLVALLELSTASASVGEEATQQGATSDGV